MLGARLPQPALEPDSNQLLTPGMDSARYKVTRPHLVRRTFNLFESALTEIPKMHVFSTTLSRLALTTTLCAGLMLSACGPADEENTEQEEEETASQTLDLDVNQLEQGSIPDNARLAVVWFQLDDDGPDPAPVIAYDAAFDASASTVTIPTADIANPTEPVLLCQRSCDDETQCECQEDSPIQAGLALTFVVNDADQSGSIEPAELSDDSAVFGVANTVLAWSPETVADADNTDIFQSDLLEGLNPYDVVADPDSSFDRLEASDFDTTFELSICPEASDTCEVPFPNLS